MNIKEKNKQNKGITLISLIVTVILMLILAGVTISMIQDDGIFDYTEKAVGDTQNAINQERDLIDDIINNYIKPNTNKYNAGKTISKEETYIGDYADVDGDGTVDGVIYADLAFSKSGTWNPAGSTETYATTGGEWSYSAESNLKEYVVSKNTYEGNFGTKPVIKASSKEGTDRFYVMALSDVNTGTEYCWYAAAYEDGIPDYSNYSYKFGTGKTNTHNMITAWNSEKYGAKDDDGEGGRDVWGVIQEEVYGKNYSKETKTVNDVIWFLPSANELAAFGSAFNITDENYSGTYVLERRYWSSSMEDEGYAYCARLDWGYFFDSEIYEITRFVRLSTTF